MVMVGFDIHLYLNPQGELVITDKVRPELVPLNASQGFTLCAPLDAAVRADVQILVGELDIEIPPGQTVLLNTDERLTPEVVAAAKQIISARRNLVQKVQELQP